MAKKIKARDVMSKDIKGIDENASLAEAATRMISEKVSSLIVNPGEKDQPFGIVTSKDIVNAYADGLNLETTQVKHVASMPLIVVTPGVPIVYAARLMKRSGLRHLAVFNGKEIVGILSNMDILRALAKG